MEAVPQVVTVLEVKAITSELEIILEMPTTILGVASVVLGVKVALQMATVLELAAATLKVKISEVSAAV